MLCKLATLALVISTLSLVEAQSKNPGDACSGAVSYCVAGPIILRCDGTKLYPGNCDDNTNEPPFGATCVESSPTAGDASCHINAGPSSSSTGTSSCEPTATVTVTETVSTCPATVTGPTTTPIIAVNATATGNSSLPHASLTYSSSLPSPTFQSGGDSIRGTGFGMLMVAALMGAFGLV